MIVSMAGYAGKINWDSSKPDGMLKKCMDVSRMEDLGFKLKIILQVGIKQMISIYRNLKAAT
jgi:GDP-L-fucose synthase